MSKSKSLFLGRFKGLGAWEYAGTIGNGHSFAHAKYGGNPKEKHLFRDHILFLKCLKNLWGLSALRAPAVGPYIYSPQAILAQGSI